MILFAIEIRVAGGWEPSGETRTSETRAHLRMKHLRERFPSHEYRVRPWVALADVLAAIPKRCEEAPCVPRCHRRIRNIVQGLGEP